MKKRINLTRTAFMVLPLLVLLLLVAGPKVTLSAASKPSLNKSSMTIPIGKYDKDSGWSAKDKKGEDDYIRSEALSVTNKTKGAGYTFTSSNTAVATIGKSGGYVVGQKSGSATITCKQTYKKKVSVIGTCKVTVKQSSVMGTRDFSDISLGKQLCGTEWFGNGDGGEYGFYPSPYTILYRNLNAKYSFKIDKKGFTMKEDTLTSAEKKQGYHSDNQSNMVTRYTASKVGTYKISVIETFQGKQRTIGTFTMKVHDVELIKEPLDVGINSTASVLWLMNYYRNDKSYYFEVEDSGDSIIEFVTLDNSVGLEMKGIKLGTATVKVYEDSKKGRFLGSCTVNVIEKPAESIEVGEYSEQMTVGVKESLYLSVKPIDTTDVIEITSSNPEVLKAELKEGNELSLDPLKAGDVVVTLKAGKLIKELTIKVVDTQTESF